VKSTLSDGLYVVTTDYFSAAFRVKDGEVLWIAPVLVKQFRYWETVAEKIE
jgi:hypothetical protein